MDLVVSARSKGPGSMSRKSVRRTFRRLSARRRRGLQPRLPFGLPVPAESAPREEIQRRCDGLGWPRVGAPSTGSGFPTTERQLERLKELEVYRQESRTREEAMELIRAIRLQKVPSNWDAVWRKAPITGGQREFVRRFRVEVPHGRRRGRRQSSAAFRRPSRRRTRCGCLTLIGWTRLP